MCCYSSGVLVNKSSMLMLAMLKLLLTCSYMHHRLFDMFLQRPV